MHGLSKEQLASRQVEIIDIASAKRDYWSYIVGSNTVDFSRFKSERTGRGPLLKEWQVPVFFIIFILITMLKSYLRKVWM